MPKIYTKVGDRGETQLVGGQKVLKHDPHIQAYGTIDELNSSLGLVRSQLMADIERLARESRSTGLDQLSSLASDLELIQHWLFDLGSLLATLPADRAKFKLAQLTQAHIDFLERRIDAATDIMEPLKNFILPGGSELAARLHVARTIARRGERAMVEVFGDLPEFAIPYINRISDYLFVMARLANHVLDVTDVQWQKTVHVPK